RRRAIRGDRGRRVLGGGILRRVFRVLLATEALPTQRRVREQLAADLERDRLRIRVFRHARVALAVGDVRAVAAVQHLDVVDAEVLDDAVGVGFLLEADDLERAL